MKNSITNQLDTNERQTLFISDLHLDESHPEITTLFLELLAYCAANKVDALYILGDLFEAWIGDDDNTPFHQRIMRALKTTTRHGVSIYFMPGNRDFLIGKHFMHKTGCQLLSADEEKIMLYGEPVVIMHGDTLCTRDVKYLAWRKRARNRFLHTILFLMWPLAWRRKAADKMRHASHQHTQMTERNIMDVTHSEVERVMQEHQVDTLIHGHTHRPAIHVFSINGAPATRIVLDAWHNHGNVLTWKASGEKSLVTLNLE